MNAFQSKSLRSLLILSLAAATAHCGSGNGSGEEEEDGRDRRDSSDGDTIDPLDTTDARDTGADTDLDGEISPDAEVDVPDAEEVDDAPDISPDAEEVVDAGPAVCGNNILEEGEGCDDGNRVAGDGCSNTCRVECPDADIDFVCDADDICPGFDDNADRDSDGTPDGCDPDTELCTDGRDNDGDRDVDCADSDCADSSACQTTETNCTDGVDNDRDSFLDCEDRDCELDVTCFLIEFDCSDGLDDDDDGFVDCDDFDCDGDFACEGGGAEICDDGADNDGDRFIDCDDFDCTGTPECPVGPTEGTCDSPGIITGPGTYSGTNVGRADVARPGCAAGAGGLDDVWSFQPSSGGTWCFLITSADFDTAINIRRGCGSGFSEVTCDDDDAPGGTGLWSMAEPSLSGGTRYTVLVGGSNRGDTGSYDLFVARGACPDTIPEICDDSFDNDDDGDTDCADSDCDGDASCGPQPEVCTDSRDNDLDGDTDCDDTDCAAATPCLPVPEVCTDARDNDRDGDIDCADADCDADVACIPVPEVCDDRRDNDFDGDTDCADADCAAATNCLPPEDCGDGIDNDLDTAIDCTDTDCAADLDCLIGTCLTPVVVSAAGSYDGNTTSFVDSEDGSCGGTGGRDQVWQFTPPTTGLWCARTDATFDTLLYSREICGSASTELVCDDDIAAGTNQNSEIESTLTAGRAYYFVVDGYDSGDFGAYSVEFFAGPCVVVPPVELCGDSLDNDSDGDIDCEDADCADDADCLPDGDGSCSAPRVITGPGTYEGSNVGRTDSARTGCTTSAGGLDDNWLFQPPTTGTWCLEVLSPTFTSAIVVRTVCGNGTELTCDNNDESVVEAEVSLTAGRSYFVGVDGNSPSQTGTYDLSVRSGRCSASSAEICDNGTDDDGDSDADCADSDCAAYSSCEITAEICDDGRDNDGDTDVDCADADCDVSPACVVAEICDDTIDNDGDSAVDCADTECATAPACVDPEICDDEIDNDGDALADCADSDCFSNLDCAAPEVCDDARDNDLDGDTDCADSDCALVTACIPDEVCNDMEDNDLDGDIDCDDADCLASISCGAGSCSLALEITGPGVFSGNTTDSGDDTEGSCQGGSAPEQVWAFTPSTSGIWCVRTNAAWDTAIYNRSACDTAGTELDCNDDIEIFTNSNSQIESTLTAGTEYFYFVDGYSSTSFGAYTLEVYEGACPLPAEICDDGLDNDEDLDTDCADTDCAEFAACLPPVSSCEDANPVTGAGTYAGNTASREDTLEGSCLVSASGGHDQVWDFTAPRSGTWCVRVVDANWDSVLYNRTTCGDDATQISCNDDENAPTVQTSRLENTLTAGVTYSYVVDGFTSADSGSYSLEITEGVCVASVENCRDGIDNDRDGDIDCDDSECSSLSICIPSGNGSCSTPTDIGGFGTFSGTTSFANREGSCSFSTTGGEEVIEWRPPTSGAACIVADGTEAWDSVLYARTTCIDESTEIACSDDSSETSYASYIDVNGTVGTPVFIFADTYDNTSTSRRFTIRILRGTCADVLGSDPSCTDAEDNDTDDDVDCADLDCSADPACVP